MMEAVGVNPRSISKILIPCEHALGIDRVYQSALSMAREASAGLVLLRIQDDSDAKLASDDAQSRYSELRGLQAKLQSCPVPCKIESAYGSVADCVLDYAHSHDIDLIVMSADEIEEADKVCSEPFVQRVQEMAQCQTVIVRDS